MPEPLNRTQVVDLYLRRIEKAGRPVEGRKVYPLERGQASFSHAANMMGWAYQHGLVKSDMEGDPYGGKVSLTSRGKRWLEQHGSADIAADFEIERLTNE